MNSMLSFVLLIGTIAKLTYAFPFGSNYELWCTGNCKVDAKPASTTPGVVLMGGGVS